MVTSVETLQQLHHVGRLTCILSSTAVFTGPRTKMPVNISVWGTSLLHRGGGLARRSVSSSSLQVAPSVSGVTCMCAHSQSRLHVPVHVRTLASGGSSFIFPRWLEREPSTAGARAANPSTGTPPLSLRVASRMYPIRWRAGAAPGGASCTSRLADQQKTAGETPSRCICNTRVDVGGVTAHVSADSSQASSRNATLGGRTAAEKIVGPSFLEK